MIPYRFKHWVLVVNPFTLDDDEMQEPRPRLRELLRLIVYQAMSDGMLRIRIDALT